MECGVELDSADQGYRFSGCKIRCYRVDEVCGVDADTDEDVQGGNLCYRDGDEAAVCVMDQEVAA